MKTISICGLGFVGSALKEGMKKHYHIHTYDKFCPEKSTVDSLAELCTKSYIMFVCVPTPMKMNTGECDTSIVEEVVGEIYEHAKKPNGNGKITVAIKSTVPPGTTARLHEKYRDKLNVVFQPEFLREATANEDFRTQTHIVIGGESQKDRSYIKKVYENVFPYSKIVECNSTVAEMVKLYRNIGLACRISLANEFYEICNALDIEYGRVKDIALLDNRMGSHWDVPGPDGSLGFSKSCFPKDLNSMIHESEMLGVDPKVMKAAWEKNLEVRPERDWEQLEGRAISKTKSTP